MIGRIFWKVSSQTNAKSVSHEILEVHGQPQKFINEHNHFFLWPYQHQACQVSNILGKDLTTLNILRTARAIFMKLCMVILQGAR